MAQQKGMRVSVYRNASFEERGIDCTNNGHSSRCTEITVVGVGIPELFPVTEDAPAFKVVRRLNGYVCLEPVENPEGAGWMAGGNIANSSDSRFGKHVAPHPVAIHDRQETWKEYDILSR